MTITTMSSRAFNQNTAGAKKAARLGPVFVTDRGKPAHVLLTIGEYRRLSGTGPTLVDMLGMGPEHDDIELEIPRSRELARAADFD